MNFIRIQTEMATLGTAPDNPHGNCTSCSVEAARALVSGITPVAEAAGGAVDMNIQATLAHAQVKMNILPDINPNRVTTSNREDMIWRFLLLSPPGVFVLEQSSDHCYNFVKHNGLICLVDAATLTFVQINAPGDCTIATPPYPDGYNYLDPEGDDDEDPNLDTLTIWRWGDLHAHYH